MKLNCNFIYSQLFKFFQIKKFLYLVSHFDIDYPVLLFDIV